MIQPKAESLLALDCDGWNLLPNREDADGGLLTTLGKVGTLAELLAVYEQSVGHLTLAPPLDLGTQVQVFVKRQGGTDSVWFALQEWLLDQRRPWRQYHACQALLSNMVHVPPSEKEALWDRIAGIVELTRAEKIESDDAQVWRLEAELAANYLRIVDLGGYELASERAVAVSWWAAREVTEVLTSKLLLDDVAPQVRQWRSDLIARGTSVIHDAWLWLGPKSYSPARFAALNHMNPRVIALLLSIGEFTKSSGIESIPANVRQRFLECFCAALAVGDPVKVEDGQGLWMWGQSLVEATKAFVTALSIGKQSELSAQVVGFIDTQDDPSVMRRSLEQLPTTDETEAILLCAGIRTYCYRHANAGDAVLPFLRDAEWRDACANRIPMLGWDLLAQGLLVMQDRDGIGWAVELPYIFLRLAEASRADVDRATSFLACLVMSSASSNNGGALKSLRDSPRLPKLRPLMKKVKEKIEEIARVADPGVKLRLQMVRTLCEIF